MTERPAIVAVIDQGSTATKGAVATPEGRLLFTTELPVERRVDGDRVEHDPLDLLTSVRTVLARCREAQPVDAIGLTCQRSTCLLWNAKDGQPLTSAISWQDRREQNRVRALRDRHFEVASRTGLRLSPHYAAPKLAGLLDADPGLRAGAENGDIQGGTLDAFLIRHLTGAAVTDPTHAGRTLLYNLHEDAWDPELCALWGLPAAMLPELRPSAGPRGAVDGGEPLLASVGDQQAALLGHGGWTAGVTAVHFGTGAFVLSGIGNVDRRHPGLLTAVLASTSTERRLQLEGSINSAGSAVDAMSRKTGQRPSDWSQRSLDDLSPPWILPAMSGLGAPWWRPELSDLLPRDVQGTPEALFAGILNGLAHRVTDITEAMSSAGPPISALRTSGKLTRISGLMQRLADLTGTPVEVSKEEEAGLRGLARLVSGTLDVPADESLARRFEPRWDRSRARAERQRWLAFLQEVLREEGIRLSRDTSPAELDDDATRDRPRSRRSPAR